MTENSARKLRIMSILLFLTGWTWFTSRFSPEATSTTAPKINSFSPSTSTVATHTAMSGGATESFESAPTNMITTTTMTPPASHVVLSGFHDASGSGRTNNNNNNNNYNKRDPCRQRPCLNGGNCVPTGVGQFVCNCRNGWSGFFCESTISRPYDCAAQPRGFYADHLATCSSVFYACVGGDVAWMMRCMGGETTERVMRSSAEVIADRLVFHEASKSCVRAKTLRECRGGVVGG